MQPEYIIDKYLAKHADTVISTFDGFPYHFNHVLIIPAYDEDDKLFDVLDSIKQKSVLVILIINAQENSPEEIIKKNIHLNKLLKRRFFEIWRAKDTHGISMHQTLQCSLLLIDRSSKNLLLPKKTGVGLARKIAADIALKLIHDKCVRSHWIHCTDADVVLPKDYFSRTQDISKSQAAVIYPYTHVVSNDSHSQQEAVQLYEISLRHYVIGLQQAGSPYAFPTIGSTIAIDHTAYAKVHGFPIREAGEDFYILNKLAKMGHILQLDGEPILIEGRLSNRVPFGTGKTVEKIAHMNNAIEEFPYYHPAIFEALKQWLDIMKTLTPKTKIHQLCNTMSGTQQGKLLVRCLERIGTFHAIEKAVKTTRDITTFRKHLMTWFDGFRTLKFVHELRDNGIPSISLSQLIQLPMYECLCLQELPPLSRLTGQFKKLQASYRTHRK